MAQVFVRITKIYYKQKNTIEKFSEYEITAAMRTTAVFFDYAAYFLIRDNRFGETQTASVLPFSPVFSVSERHFIGGYMRG